MSDVDEEETAAAYPCSGYSDCTNSVAEEDDVCGECVKRDERENAGGCPGCGGYCQVACR